MALFARDQNQAEQGLRTSTGESSTSRQSLDAPSPAQLRPAGVPSTSDSESNLSGIDGNKMVKDTRYRHEVDKYTLGWPRFAATQVDRHNGGMVRRFSYLTARLLLYGQGRLHNLQQQLEEYENGPTYNPLGLSARQTRNVGEECPPDRLDLIMEEVRVELHQYLNLVIRDRDTQTLIGALPAEVIELYEHAVGEQMVDSAGIQPATELFDFVYTRTNLVYNGLRGLIYSDLGQLVLRPVFGGRQLSSALVMGVLKALAVGFVLFMLLGPMGIMYLLGLGTSASFGLVVGFVVVFCVAFMATGATLEHVLVGTSAYVAVLASILVQTQAGAGTNA